MCLDTTISPRIPSGTTARPPVPTVSIVIGHNLAENFQPEPKTWARAHTTAPDFLLPPNPAASMFSFTLQVKSEGYRRTRNTRVFLCASSPDESGREALDWALESLVQDGDELIVCRGVDEEVLGMQL